MTANQSATVTVRYSPTSAGSDSQNVSFTGGGGATHQVFGSAYLPTADVPTISPTGGIFADSVQVILACSTPGATIRYTTDGNDPTGGAVAYSVPFTLTSSATVKAKAFKNGYNASAIAAASFAVTSPHPPTLSYARHGSNFVVWWPTSAIGYMLEYKTNLSAPNWTPNPSSPVTFGDQNVVSNTITIGNMFFRLKK
ncbi:MAG: chitobiase/beta-hexosaminidase C-terminal domain-containing protein [Verrucomicrobiota bacterium]